MSRWACVPYQACELFQAWEAARDEVRIAYSDWLAAADDRRDAYARYLAAADQETAAGEHFARLSLDRASHDS